jgi:hypothetical protein
VAPSFVDRRRWGRGWPRLICEPLVSGRTLLHSDWIDGAHRRVVAAAEHPQRVALGELP